MIEDNFANKASSKIQEGAQKMERKAESISNTVQEAAKKIGNQISDSTDELKANAEKYSDEALEYLKSNPLKSVAIAAGVGLLVGYFCGK